MRWTVTWEKHAEHHLADLWMDAPDRKTITAAVAQLEAKLASSPLTAGNELSEGLYELTAFPVRVVYEVSEPDRLVHVTGVGIVQ